MAKKQQKPQKKCQNIKCGGIIDAFNTCLTCGEPYKEPKARPEEAKKAGTRVPRPQRDTPDEFKLWQVSADDRKTWVDLTPTIKANTEVSGREPGKTYWFRFRATTAKLSTLWCDPVPLMVR